jgi:WD40 repeat protein
MMKNYLQRQTKYFPLLGEQAHLIEAWAIDLHRLVAKFGINLLGLPTSIYSLIPPFCPQSSAISTVFGTPQRRIKVVGIEDNGWDDRLACIDSQDKQAFAVACGEGFFAVGFLNSIVICHATTCQEWRKFDHGSQLRQLGFDSTGNILVSVGKRDLKIWALERSTLQWKFETSHDILSFSFADKEKSLMVALKNNSTIKWLLDSGEIAEKMEWKSTFEDERNFRRPPLLGAFSPNQTLLAVVYRGRPITIWDLECDDLHGYVGRENRDLSFLALGTNTSPSSLVFNSCHKEA